MVLDKLTSIYNWEKSKRSVEEKFLTEERFKNKTKKVLNKSTDKYFYDL